MLRVLLKSGMGENSKDMYFIFVALFLACGYYWKQNKKEIYVGLRGVVSKVKSVTAKNVAIYAAWTGWQPQTITHGAAGAATIVNRSAILENSVIILCFLSSFSNYFALLFLSCPEMATRRTGKQVQRSTTSSGISPEDNPDIEGNEGYESDEESGDRKETRLTLMEEVLLLGLKDKEVLAKIFESDLDMAISVCNHFCL